MIHHSFTVSVSLNKIYILVKLSSEKHFYKTPAQSSTSFALFKEEMKHPDGCFNHQGAEYDR